MKLTNSIACLTLFFLLTMLLACEEDIQKTELSDEITANTLNEPSAASRVLGFDNRDEIFDTFEWTKPDFGFEADITYRLQMDLEGSNFTNPVNLVNTSDLTASPTVSVVNNALLGKGAEPDEAITVEFRIASTINPNIEPIYSNVTSVSITPYEVSFPPIYIIGDAQSWNLGSALELTSTGPGTYQGTGLFQADGKFRFFATPSWDAEQWGWSFFSAGDIPEVLADGADGDSNFLFEGETGVYTIMVDLNSSTITLEEGEFPTLFVIGDAQNNWDLASAAALTYLGGTRFEGDVDFQQDGHFRFFEEADWNAAQYGYSYFAEGTIPDEFIDAEDEESNFIFTGATDTYTITVDLSAKTIVAKVVTAYPASLYLVGDDQNWGFTDELSTTSEGVFEGTTTFTNGSTFRFLEEVDNWSDDYGAGYFTGGIPDDLEAAGDPDDNFTFTGTTGTYTITVDFINKTVALSQ